MELYNAQVVLRGVETSGYVIVSAAKASLLACDHKPIWQGQQLRSKSTLVGSVESMQVCYSGQTFLRAILNTREILLYQQDFIVCIYSNKFSRKSNMTIFRNLS